MADVLDGMARLGFTVTHRGREIVATHTLRPERFVWRYDDDADREAARSRLARQCLDALLGWMAAEPWIANTFDVESISDVATEVIPPATIDPENENRPQNAGDS